MAILRHKDFNDKLLEVGDEVVILETHWWKGHLKASFRSGEVITLLPKRVRLKVKIEYLDNKSETIICMRMPYNIVKCGGH